MDVDILIRWPVSVEILLLDALVVIFQQKNMVLDGLGSIRCRSSKPEVDAQPSKDTDFARPGCLRGDQ